eukprot:TRINITY_DN47708_c0_g1_i1.p1 TRINITY_DN47708_c0_g1~~TRINITY_DN47708_c0_g1_i1.p1  ORF type:complete len:567 (-),score=96.61 TRINITY_DN47708_c0_g1_i1:15-1715(-)
MPTVSTPAAFSSAAVQGYHEKQWLQALLAVALAIANIAGDEAAVPRGDPGDCWIGALQHESCCFPAPAGNAGCWDGVYTYSRCCTASAPSIAAPPRLHAPVDVNSVSEISELGGCELNIFQEFKARAGAWYRDGAPTLALFHEFVYITRRFDSMYRSCAPAALTAMLLKLESMYFEEEDVWSGLFAHYTERHHEAVASGSLLQSHHVNGWPLLEGIRSVNAWRSLGKQGLQTADGRPTLDLVICYCGRNERIDWLRGFRKLPWRDEDRSSYMRALVALRIYHKCGDASQARREEERQRLVAEWSKSFHTVEVRYVDDQVRADDCSAYLSYIVDRYNDLPEFSVFLHADAPEHIPTVDLLMDTVFAASRGYLPPGVGFIHLAHNYVRHDCPGATAECKNPDAFEVAQLWRNVFGSSITPSMTEGDLNAYCCVQFLVRRERIHLRERGFYARALSYFGETPDSYFALFPVGKVVWLPDTRGRTPCQLAMYIWHVIFGEDLRLPRRHRDPRMPLFVRMLNIEAEAVREAQQGEDGVNGRSIELNGDNSNKDDMYYRMQSLFTDNLSNEA